MLCDNAPLFLTSEEHHRCRTTSSPVQQSLDRRVGDRSDRFLTFRGGDRRVVDTRRRVVVLSDIACWTAVLSDIACWRRVVPAN